MINETVEFDDPRHEVLHYCQIQSSANILHIISGLMCFLFNIVILFAILCKTSARKSTNRLISNLLLCDSILGAAFFIRGIQRELAECPELQETQWSCFIRNGLPTVAVMLCLYATLGVTIGRFTAVAFPMWYSSRSACLDNTLLFATWTLTVCWLIAEFFGLDKERVIRSCWSDLAYNQNYYYAVHYAKLPVIVMFVVFYGCMLFLLYRNRKSMESSRSVRQTAAEKNVNTFVSIIVAIYLILWLVPLIVQQAAKKILGKDKYWSAYLIRNYVVILTVFTALSNAIVFFNRSKHAQSVLGSWIKKFGATTTSHSRERSSSSSSRRTISVSMHSLDSRVQQQINPRKSVGEDLDVTSTMTEIITNHAKYAGIMTPSAGDKVHQDSPGYLFPESTNDENNGKIGQLTEQSK